MATEQDRRWAGSMPDAYDRYLAPSVFRPFAVELAARAARLAPRRVLEIAAGTGVLTAELLAALPDAHVTATDLNEPMVRYGAGRAPGADWEQADAQALPFDDEQFDLVACQFGVMFFPDKEKGYCEAYRVLVSGGRYFFSVWDSHRHNPIGRLVTEILDGFFPHDPPQFYQVPFSYHRIDPIKDSLGKAGFADLRIAVLTLNKIVPNVPTYARAVVLGNPLIDQIRARGGVDPERVIDSLTKAIPREFGTAPTRIPLQAIVFEAMRR